MGHLLGLARMRYAQRLEQSHAQSTIIYPSSRKSLSCPNMPPLSISAAFPSLVVFLVNQHCSMPHRCNALIKLNNSIEKREKANNRCTVVYAHRLALIEPSSYMFVWFETSIVCPPALVGLVYEAPHWALMSPPLGCVGPAQHPRSLHRHPLFVLSSYKLP
jgi:hypothetical protein